MGTEAVLYRTASGQVCLALYGSLALQAVVVTLLAAAFGMVACNFMSGLF
jgi:hypothetical protein